LTGNLESVTLSPSKPQSITKIVEVVSALKERLDRLESPVEGLEKKRGSQSRFVAPSNRDGTVKGKHDWRQSK